MNTADRNKILAEIDKLASLVLLGKKVNIILAYSESTETSEGVLDKGKKIIIGHPQSLANQFIALREQVHNDLVINREIKKAELAKFWKDA